MVTTRSNVVAKTELVVWFLKLNVVARDVAYTTVRNENVSTTTFDLELVICCWVEVLLEVTTEHEEMVVVVTVVGVVVIGVTVVGVTVISDVTGNSGKGSEFTIVPVTGAVVETELVVVGGK